MAQVNFIPSVMLWHGRDKQTEFDVYSIGSKFYAAAVYLGGAPTWPELFSHLSGLKMKSDGEFWLESRSMTAAIVELRKLLGRHGNLWETTYRVIIGDLFSQSSNPKVVRSMFLVPRDPRCSSIEIKGRDNLKGWPHTPDAVAFLKKVKASRHVKNASWAGASMVVELTSSSAAEAKRLKTFEELVRLHEPC